MHYGQFTNLPNLCLKNTTAYSIRWIVLSTNVSVPIFPPLEWNEQKFKLLYFGQFPVPSTFLFNCLISYIKSLLDSFRGLFFFCFSPAELILNLTHLLVCAFFVQSVNFRHSPFRECPFSVTLSLFSFPCNNYFFILLRLAFIVCSPNEVFCRICVLSFSSHFPLSVLSFVLLC